MTSTENPDSKQEEGREAQEFTLEEDDGFEEFEMDDAPVKETTEASVMPRFLLTRLVTLFHVVLERSDVLVGSRLG